MNKILTLSQLEQYLSKAAWILKGPVDASDFKVYIFPLLFFKRISDVYEEEYDLALRESGGDIKYAELPEMHRFEIPVGCKWQNIRELTTNVGIGIEKCLPGDIIYSYAFKKISCIGIIESKASTSFKPKEFGNTGQNWDREGWLVKVNWQPLKNPFHPKEVFEQIKDHLPKTHSPLNKLGKGSEGCYLGDINQTFGEMLMKFIKELNNNVEIDMSFLEDEIERTKAYLEDIKACEKIENITEKEALIKARLGHGQFRRDVEILEPICRVTGLDKKEFLIASHIKSWKESNNYERLDGSNGLLLSPHVDKLFDRHWISFAKNGKLIWKSEKVKLTLEKWGIKECKILKPLSSKQESYMNYHRKLLKD